MLSREAVEAVEAIEEPAPAARKGRGRGVTGRGAGRKPAALRGSARGGGCQKRLESESDTEEEVLEDSEAGGSDASGREVGGKTGSMQKTEIERMEVDLTGTQVDPELLPGCPPPVSSFC